MQGPHEKTVLKQLPFDWFLLFSGSGTITVTKAPHTKELCRVSYNTNEKQRKHFAYRITGARIVTSRLCKLQSDEYRFEF